MLPVADYIIQDCTQQRQKPREPRACKVCESTEHIAKVGQVDAFKGPLLTISRTAQDVRSVLPE
jgi:hypothetical protein